MQSLVRLLKRYKRSILPPYSPKDYLNLGVTAFLLLSLPVTLFLVHQRQELMLKAKEAGLETSEPPSGPEFASNELLIKVKKASRGKIHDGNTTDTGISALNILNLRKDPEAKFDYKIKGFEKVAKAGKESKTDEDLYSWYKLTLDAPATLIEGKLDNAKQIVEENPANSEDKPHANSGQAAANLQQIIDKLTKDPDVENVELNYKVNVLVVPNDPYYSSVGSWGQTYPDLWGIKKINPELAWDQTTGAASIVVAGIDTGVDRNHEDIKGNIWVNTNEIPGNGIDDDANGYKDDYYGWDWANNDNDPMDDHGHGTHTVGTIAAVGNNTLGVVGINWTSRIMALKFLNSGGSGSLDNGIKALQYAADMGARVSSNSWGCACNSVAMDDAVKYEHDRGMVMVAAAGNSNADAIGFSPASADYAVAVAASDSNDVKASFSNWGEKIDVAAPGVDILSIRAANNPMCTADRTVGTNYCRVSGTSMATPHVAGLAALLLAKNPALTNEEVRQIIRTGSEDLAPAGKDSNFGFGRINANGSMNLSITHPLTPAITSPSSRTLVNSPSMNITGSIGGPNFASYKLEYGTGRSPSSWTSLSTSTTQPVVNTTLATLNTLALAEGIYTIRLTAIDTLGKTYQFQIFDLTVDNFDAALSYPTGLVPLSSIDIIGTAITKNGMPFANYKLEWGTSLTSLSTSGITLVNGGNTAVTNGKLATWDTSTLANGQSYYLRLTVNSSTGLNLQTTITVKADKDLLSGWPKHFDNAYFSSITPVVVDLDGDGAKELIYDGPDNKLYAYKKDGTTLSGFPVLLTTNTGSSYTRDTEINVEDLDSDGKKEIIANAYNGTSTLTYIVKSNGSLYPGWPQIYIRNPVITDLDGDGTKEIFSIQVATWVVRTDVILHAYHLNGSEISGFPKPYTLPPVGLDAGQIFPSSPGGTSIADLNKDGKPEIAWSYANRIYLFDNLGNIMPGWPYMVPTYTSSFDGTSRNYLMTFEGTSAAGDIDGDGQLELVSLSTDACIALSSGGFQALCYLVGPTVMYSFKIDGTILPGWPKTDASDGFKSGAEIDITYGPVLSDMDSDGKDEIIIGGSPLTIFDAEGKKNLTTPQTLYLQPALSDVDGDGKLDYASSYSGNVAIIKENGSAYSNYWSKNIGKNKFSVPQVLADMDNNGKLELAGIDQPYGISSTGLIGGVNSIYLWELPTTAGIAKYEWPMFGHDPARSGRLLLGPIPTPPPITPTPTPSSTPTPTPTGGDTILPTVSITSPVNGGVVTRNSSVNITASASDNVRVTKVEFLVSGSLKCTDTASPYSCSWKVTGKPNASYTLTAKAYDAAANSASASITVVSQ